MRNSIFYYKELTPAEVGNTGTHEIYVRMPNNFEYEDFFKQRGEENGSVLEVNFSALDITDGVANADNEDIRFVYFANSNKEKRLPGLRSLFEKHNVKEGDIFSLESRTENGHTSFIICFYRKGSMVLQPTQIYFSKTYHDGEQIKHTEFNLEEPRQQIFFGAPGTGKSYRVEQITETYKEDVIRTTFHPDSDYSTFVGCYKPTMLPADLAKKTILDYDNLVAKFKEYLEVKNPYQNVTRACTLFGYDYHDSIVRMQEGNTHTIPELVTDAYKSGTTYDSQVRAGMACYEESATPRQESSEIIYSFVPQAFTQAYTKAWLNPERPIFLVIEELNRGNCAQIFGDIFQLLDRNENSESAYSIIPDHDLQQHLIEEFKNAENIPEDIKKAKAMRLPSNLYIWATMNTSDQSLFPIDSAFKRRWIWKYIPIADAGKDYKIKVGDHQYDWWTFVEKVNGEIELATKSEDKKLGYFFAKADNGIIAADTFVSKVVFYLWNDVFKDSFDKTIFKNDLTFHKFFEPNGEPKLEVIDQFMHDLELKADGEE